ncbi:MAG: metallophosphoesterase [Thermoanaerobaculia bacterium]|nr:metallophosphoesterase [Thermoanaerobaculia bacterium]
MKVVVFSDVHGNLPALELMLKREAGADRFICLGDVVNYGPWSRECVELVRSLKNCVCLMGNHETYFRNRKYDGVHPLPQKFFEICIRDFDRFDWIEKLPEDYLFRDYHFVHTLEGKNIYPDSTVEIGENYFIGHSHHQFYKRIHSFDLYNVGSLGQNRKYINVISYAQFFPEERTVQMQNLIYDERILINEMKSRKYPEECIAYYEAKERLAAPEFLWN